MTGFHTNIEKKTIDNQYFREVLYTGKYMQLVVMSLRGGEEIGMEIHQNVDQFFRIEEGSAKFILNGEEIIATKDDVVIVTAGTNHNVINASASDDLKVYTIYAPPNHPDGTIHKTKAEAEAAEH